MNITVYGTNRAHTKFWRVENPSRAWVLRHDDGAIISCGMTLREEDLTEVGRGAKVTEVSHDEWNHSGCQSSCVRRGQKECRW